MSIKIFSNGRGKSERKPGHWRRSFGILAGLLLTAQVAGVTWRPSRRVTNEQRPLPRTVAAWGVARSVVRTAILLARRQIHQPPDHVGIRFRFADDTSARVYRESVVDCGSPTKDPCVLVVAFRLRAVRGWGHNLFRWESILNTPLFIGFPGFVSKLWLAHDERGVYRGVYEWDGPELAEHYARSLWRVLALGCVPDSIHYHVLPGLRRDELLDSPHLCTAVQDDLHAWWRLVAVT